jgi:proteasome accessory factor B
MFERDKDVLRDIGVPIEVVSTDAWDVEHGYTIDKDRYYLPTSPSRPRSSRRCSSRSVRPATSRPRRPSASCSRAPTAGSWRAWGRRRSAARPTRTCPVPPRPWRRDAACASPTDLARRPLGPLGGRVRTGVRGGHWYLVGLDLDREEIRSFRLSRISDDLEIAGEGTEPPEGFRAAEHVRAGPWGPGDSESDATIAFAPDVAWWATKGVRERETVRTREDGWIEVRVPWSPGEGLVPWILSFGPDAEAWNPPSSDRRSSGRLEAILAS